ncbi:hypothetical protein ACWFMI_23605 [Nocardiopsis terrae]|uniref:hypothetical protein n=1 Tax=Streptomyces sp. NPDC057554 TaxID=3350538 RepID=UPI00367C74CF
MTPSLPSPLDSRIVPPPTAEPDGISEQPFSWPDLVDEWAEGWDSVRLSARDIRAAADRLNQKASDWKLGVRPDVKEQLEVLDSESKDRPVLGGRGFYGGLLGPSFGHINLAPEPIGGRPPFPGEYELRTCCPEFMKGDTHTPDCYRIKAEERRMVPGDRSGGYDDEPELRRADDNRIRINTPQGATLDETMRLINKAMRAQRVSSKDTTGATGDDQNSDTFDKYIPRVVSAAEATKLRDQLSEAHPRFTATTTAKAAPYVPPPLPEQIRIGHATYTLTTSAHISDGSEDTELAGWSDEATRRLEISANGAHDYVRETLLHEILHQCLRVTGTDPDADAKAGLPDVEERTLMGMAGPLLGVLCDHPELLAYLTAPAPRDGVG